MNRFNNLRQNVLVMLSLLTWVEGVIFNILYWMEPSSAKNAWLAGFSRDRLLLGGGAAFFMILLSAFLIICTTQPPLLKNPQHKIIALLKNRAQRQTILLLSFLLCLISGSILALGWWQDLSILPPLFYSVFARTYPFILWAALLGLQTLVFTVYLVNTLPSTRFERGELLETLFMALCSTLILVQWAFLIFRLQPPYLFSQFVWAYSHTGYSLIHYLVLVFWIVAGVAIFAAYKKYGFSIKLVILSMLWFYLAQFFIPLIEINSESPAALSRYQQSPISHVLYSACSENPGYDKILSAYDSYFKQDFWLGTKPAGYLVFYSLLKDSASFFTASDCHSTLAHVVLFLFPLISALSIIFILKTTKEIYGQSDLLPGLLLFSLPNMLFFSLIADQALYPFLFGLTVWLSVFVSRQNGGFIAAVVLGVLLYLNIFLSFSLLPAAGFVGIWLLLNLWAADHKDKRLALLKQGCIIGFVFLLLCLLMWGGTGYAPWERYLSAFSNHRAIKQIQIFSSDAFSIIFLNHFEFFYWSGLVIFPLLIKSVINSLKQLVNHRTSPAVLFALSILLLWVILNLAGQTRGEVGRLWLFITPALTILIADAVKEWPRRFQAALLVGQMLSTVLFFQAYYIP